MKLSLILYICRVPPRNALDSAERKSGESWSVKPTFLEMTPNSQITKTITVKSNFYTTQWFELESNIRNLFTFTPKVGEIKPGREKEINIQMIGSTNSPNPIKILVRIIFI